MNVHRVTDPQEGTPISQYTFFIIYFVSIAYRIGSALNLNPGYLHPDEFFQSVELATGRIYPETCAIQTWEFQNTGPGPVRSQAALWPFANLPIYLMRLSYTEMFNETSIGGELTTRALVPARLFTVLLSIIPDVFIYWLSQQVSPSPQTRKFAVLLYSTMAYGGLVWGVRTLSNVWEMFFVCAFCFLSQQSSLTALIAQAVLSVWAIFLRPSFVVFGLPFVIHQLHRFYHLPNRLLKLFVHIPMGLCASIAITAAFIFFDTTFYSIQQQVTLDPSNWIIAPLKFLQYNSAKEKLAEHGLHAWYMYLAVHWPLVLSPPVMIAAFFPRFIHRRTIHQVCWASLVFSTLALSLIPHKETRFLLPCLPIAVVLAAENLTDYFKAKKSPSLLVTSVFLWFAYQITLAVFWDFLHQAGLIPMLRSIPDSLEANISLNIFYRTYMPPRFPFGRIKANSLNLAQCMEYAPFEESCPGVMDLAGRPVSTLTDLLRCIGEKTLVTTTIRLVLPGAGLPKKLRLEDFGNVLNVRKFFPHLSTEYLPQIEAQNCQLTGSDALSTCLRHFWNSLKSSLSLHVYVVSIPPKYA